MSWAKLHDRIDEDPKLLSLGLDARWLFVCGVAYCARTESDGFIPSAAMLRLAAEFKRPKAVAQALVMAKLWDEVDGGYLVRAFLKYNRSHEQLENDRQSAAERMANVRANIDESSGEQTPNNGQVFNRPVPVPKPVPRPKPVPMTAEQAALWGTLAEACGYDQEHMLDQHRRFIGKQATALAKMHAQPEVVVELADIIRELRHRAPTPALIVSMYPQVKELRDELDAYRGRVEMAGQIARRRR